MPENSICTSPRCQTDRLNRVRNESAPSPSPSAVGTCADFTPMTSLSTPSSPASCRWPQARQGATSHLLHTCASQLRRTMWALFAIGLTLRPLLLDRRAALGAAAALVAPLSPLSALAAGAAPIPSWDLGGVAMPTLALNTAGLSAADAERATRLALTAGITHVDFHPGIERDGVARAIASSGRGPSAFFLTTKIRAVKDPTVTPAQAAVLARKQIDEDLAVLGLPRVDMLMLRDCPDCAVMQAQWAVLEEALAAGKTRALGTVNYCEKQLDCLLESAKVKPAVNYYMFHVGMGPDAHGLRSYGEKSGVRTFGYGALGEPGPSPLILSSPVLEKIGAAHGRSPAEVAVRWAIQSGVAMSVRPTSDFRMGASACREEDSACADGLRERAAVFGWALSQEEMAEIDALDRPDGIPAIFSTACNPDRIGI